MRKIYMEVYTTRKIAPVASINRTLKFSASVYRRSKEQLHISRTRRLDVEI